MANPFKRGNTWTFYYYVKDAYGKRKQVWKGGYATKKEAEDDLKVYKAKAALGQIPTTTSRNLNLSDYLWQWLADRKQQLQPNTITSYAGVIKNHIVPAIGSIELCKLTPQIIQTFYTDLSTQLNPKTIQLIHSVLKVALKEAMAAGRADNIMSQVKPPKITKYKSKLLSQAQLMILMQALLNHKYETEIKLAIMLGLRRGEVLGIKEEDIDFDLHTLSIRRQVSIIKDSTTFKKGEAYYGLKCLKSVSSNRTLYISAEIEDLFRRKIEYNHCQKNKLKDKYNNLGLVCCNSRGNVISPKALVDNFKRVLRECNLPNVRFHDIRHSYATLCIDMNVPIKVLSQALGHSSIAITDAVYADSINAKRELANIVSKAIAKTGEF